MPNNKTAFTTNIDGMILFLLDSSNSMIFVEPKVNKEIALPTFKGKTN